MNRRMRMLCLTTACAAMCIAIIGGGVVGAQEGGIEAALSSYGFKEPKVSVDGNEVLVEYEQPVSEMGPLNEELRKIAIVLNTVGEDLSPTYLVKVRQYFDTGHIMEIAGKPDDGRAFLNNETSDETFSERLEFKPLTRGPPIVPGICEPDKGKNCENCEACACYPNEFCEPTNPKANKKGCVAEFVPPNSHLLGSEYVCDEGYEWNSDLTGCVPEMKCPPNSFKFQGECYCKDGYQWNSGGRECIPVETPAEVSTGLIFESRSKPSGSSVQIPLTLQGIEERLGNMDVTLAYDPSILQAIEVIKGGLAANSLFDYNILEGMIKISLADTEGFSGDGSIAYIGFNVLGTEGSSSPLRVIEISANGADYGLLSISTRDGVFQVTSTGEFEGDCNGDGKITSLDALCALQMAVGKIAEDLAMDVNDDGKVSSLDARSILKTAIAGS